MKKPLPIGTYQYRNEQASARKLVNCTAEKATPDSGNLVVLRRMPGIDSFGTSTTNLRGGIYWNDNLYIVSGTSLYKLTSTGGAATSLGTIPGTGKVRMAGNATNLVVVTNPDAYYTDGSTVTQITDSTFTGFGGASDVAYLDGYLIFTVPSSRRAFCTGLEALTFNALDYSDIDGATDDLVGLIVDHREIIFLKERSIELWYDAANPTGFPFSRSPDGFKEIGCASKFTAAKIGGTVYWLANDRTVRAFNGSAPSVISTVGVSKFITSPSTAYGFAYTFEDKHYYTLCLSAVTIEYDILGQEWHNRETWQQSTWDVRDIVEGFDSSLVLAKSTGKIGKLSGTTYEEFDTIQQIKWTYQEVDGDGKRLLHDRFEISMGTGVGLNAGQGSNPIIELEYSDDGGKQFTSFETRSLGAIGDYGDRVFWNRLGSSYKRVYRCNMTDPVDLIAFDTNIELRSARF